MKSSLQFFKSTLLLFAVFILSSESYSQPAEIPSHVEPFVLESGFYNGNGVMGSSAVKVFSGMVQLHNVPWLQLHFSDANLGNESYVLIKSSIYDVAQRLDGISIQQWNYFSAFFNGSEVEIELFVGAMDNNIFINIDEVVVGEWATSAPYSSICGPTDDRTASNDPATSRLLNVGCTSWIIPNGKFVSAGHCLASSTNVVEFNVPLSLPNGTIQHPGPEDQYSVDVSTKIYVNGGVGNDWGVFEVFPNSITGLMPKAAQNAYFTLVQDLSPDSIRITGYGVDGGTANQTQQTHVGPNWGSSGTTMRYQTDTQGGNSGSPVIDELTQYATGVHTHGGCNSSGGNNNGTSFFLTAFWAAVDSGIIPVELTSFTAVGYEDYAEISWITATETNNAGFSLERKSTNSNWIEVAFINGNGTTTETKAYNYVDEQLNVGAHSYRIKQIDYDGTFTYSKLVEVDITAPDNYALFQNYPNPFNPSTTIKFSVPAEAVVQLNIFNAIGEKVAEVFNGSLNAGYHEMIFDASALTSGIYFYRLESNEFVISKKMMLIK
jgi:V8-like Glu-specific endopeptidase